MATTPAPSLSSLGLSQEARSKPSGRACTERNASPWRPRH